MVIIISVIGFGIVVFIAGIRIIRPIEVGVIEFLGKYSRTANAGFNWIIPGFHKLYKINITERRIDIDPQSIITKDKLNAEVDGVIYYKVDNAKDSLYNVNNFEVSVPSLAKTTLRAVIGKMTLTEANENRNAINQEVEKILDLEVKKWGIKVIRIELQRIEPPEDVQIAMNQVVKAENEKIAALDLATAIEINADGEAIQIVNESAEKYFVGNAQLLKRLETVSESLKNNAKIIVPADTNLVNVIGDLAGSPVPLAKRKMRS